MTPQSISPLSVSRLAVRARNKAFTMAVRRSFASWGSGSSIRLPTRISGERNIWVGRGVEIGEGCWIESLNGGSIEIGDTCAFAGYVQISAALSIVFEPRVIVGRYAFFLDHNHRFDLDIPIYDQGTTDAQPVRIGEGSWIGANAVILPGVTIGRGAVVGANSVVRSDVRDRVVVAGVPAREVRQLDRSIPSAIPRAV